MLAEFVNALIGLGKSANKVDFHCLDQLPDSVFVRHGDELLEKPVPPPRRVHSAIGMDGLLDMLRDGVLAPAPEVFVAGNTITAFLDRAKRSEQLITGLNYSERFKACAGMQNGPRRLPPAEAVRFLRNELPDTGLDTDSARLSLQDIDFTRTTSAASQVDHGEQSMGKKVMAKVIQAEAVPEEFEAVMPLWSDQGFTEFQVAVRIGIFLNTDDECVEFRVLADECTAAVNSGVLAVIEKLRADGPAGLPVFQGKASAR